MDAPQGVKKPTVLVVIDGFGVAPSGDGNAIVQAQTPNFDRFIRTYPTMTVRASGEEVGLSWGEMGNSEVGHLSIGAGRVYYQTFPRINRSIADESFFENETFLSAIAHVKKHKSRLHLVGMISSGGVHSTDAHCHALLELAKRNKVKDVFVHAFLDGRDSTFNSAPDFIRTLQEKMDELNVGKIASIAGRYFAMDRDNRWERVEKSYNAMIGAGEQTATDAIQAIQDSYGKEVYDEQFVPVTMMDGKKPVGVIAENDAVVMFNFRPDRMRQMAQALSVSEFDKFERTLPANVLSVSMVEYMKDIPVHVAFPPVVVDQCLAQVLSEKGMTQLHIAETEKYAHVTFFLNGTHEEPFAGEDRVIIPSPNVSSYNEKPEMSARELTDRVVKELSENTYDFVVLNFANPDMVGHTGDFEATKKAIGVVDECLGKISDAVLARDGMMFITADHGNSEEMKNLRTGEMIKEHATNPVPFVIIGKQFQGQPSLAGEVPNGDLSLMPPVGMLADVAPTILMAMGVDQPEEMTGQSLL